jgi:hypothetical protein
MEWDSNCNIGKLVVTKDLALEPLAAKVKNSSAFSCNSHTGALLILFFSVVGPEAVPPSLLKVVMKPIATVGESYQYPPANLAALLSPLMRLNFGKHQVFWGFQAMLLGIGLNKIKKKN